MKIGFIGAGKMAEAIIAAVIESGQAAAHEIFASDIDEERRGEIKRRYGINVYSRNSVVAGSAGVVFLAVKPQSLTEAVGDLAAEFTDKHLVISIAAGKRIASIESLLSSARVVRVMPNLPAVVSEAMSVFCMGTKANPGDRDTVARLLGAFGKVLELPEDLFDAVTALSGSGPAFFAYVLKEMVAAAVKLGLPEEHARLMAEQTMLGTARLLLEKGMPPAELVRAVSSAKGTTAAGMAVLENSPVSLVLQETLSAAARRSRELNA